MKKSLFLSMATLSVLVFSCKKDNDDSLSITKENLTATYTLSSIKLKASGTEQDVTDSWVDACAKDDQTVLKADGTMNYVDAGTKCSPAGDYSGTWSVSGSKIIVDGDTSTIKSLSKNSMVLEDSYTQSGVSYTVTTNLSRK